MTEGMVFALTAAVLYGVLGVTYEFAAKRGYPVAVFIVWVQLWGAAIGLLLVLIGRMSFFNLRILEVSLLGLSCYLVGLWAYLLASRERTIAVNWTALNLSVAIPILGSVLWFHDAFTLSKVLGILLTLGAIVLVGELGVKGSGYTQRWLGYILIAVTLNGVSVMLFRFVPRGFASLYICYFFGLSSFVLLAYRLATKRPIFFKTELYAVSALSAVSQCVGIVLTILALNIAAKSSGQAGLIVFPITNGLPIPIGVAMGSLLLKQRLNRRVGWGVALACLATIFLTMKL